MTIDPLFLVFILGPILGFLCTLYRFNHPNKCIVFMETCLNFVFPVASCKGCHNTQVLFFPDVAMPCKSFTNGLVENRNIKCKYKGACRFLHDGDDSSLVEMYKTLDKATRSIDICMYLITYRWLSEFLKALKDRGVTVRLITDSAGDDEYKINNQASDLQKSGILVKTNPNNGALMHNKFVIIDNETVVLGSFNWTKNAILRNDEAIIITSQKNIVSAFVDKFKVMWNEMQQNTNQ